MSGLVVIVTICVWDALVFPTQRSRVAAAFCVACLITLLLGAPEWLAAVAVLAAGYSLAKSIAARWRAPGLLPWRDRWYGLFGMAPRSKGARGERHHG